VVALVKRRADQVVHAGVDDLEGLGGTLFLVESLSDLPASAVVRAISRTASLAASSRVGSPATPMVVELTTKRKNRWNVGLRGENWIE